MLKNLRSNAFFSLKSNQFYLGENGFDFPTPSLYLELKIGNSMKVVCAFIMSLFLIRYQGSLIFRRSDIRPQKNCIKERVLFLLHLVHANLQLHHFFVVF